MANCFRPAYCAIRGRLSPRAAPPSFFKKAFSVPWSTPFDDPIILPDGRKLLTLKDAADYITKLPKKESDLPEWQAAIEVLMLCSRGGPTMMARIGVMKALNRHVERVFNPDRKDTHWGKRKLKRNQ
jgi:hypothetical protein